MTCIIALHCDYIFSDPANSVYLPILLMVTSLVPGQSINGPSAIEVTLKCVDKIGQCNTPMIPNTAWV